MKWTPVLASFSILGTLTLSGWAQQLPGQIRPQPQNKIPMGNPVPLQQQIQQHQNQPVPPLPFRPNQPQFVPKVVTNPVPFQPQQPVHRPNNQPVVQKPVVQQPIVVPVVIVPQNIANPTTIPNLFPTANQYQNYLPLPTYSSSMYTPNNVNNPYINNYNPYSNPFTYNYANPNAYVNSAPYPYLANQFNANPYGLNPYNLSANSVWNNLFQNNNPYLNSNPYLNPVNTPANVIAANQALMQNLWQNQNQWTNQLNPVTNPWLAQNVWNNPFSLNLNPIPLNNGVNNGVFLVNGVNVNAPALASSLPLATRIALGIP